MAASMAASIATSLYSPSFPPITKPNPQFSLSSTSRFSQSLLPLFNFNPKKSPNFSSIKSSNPSSISAISTPSAETSQSSSSITPSKSLPFRVGHGFDLHRLEPGYPLIIGGINIPHDRGCEAHSDGNYYFHNFFFLMGNFVLWVLNNFD